MSYFKDKCGDVLTGGATGAAVGGSIGAAIGALGGPVTSALGAKVGGAVGSILGIFSDWWGWDYGSKVFVLSVKIDLFCFRFKYL